MNNLRPKGLDGFVGQDKLKGKLRTILQSALKRDAPMEHMLFYGAKGLGKTTLAQCMGEELDRKIQISNGANLRSIKQLLPYLGSIKKNSIFFIDEIHRMTPIVQEYLYPVMEDFRMDVGGNKGKMSIDLPNFTLIGATTDYGKLQQPLIDRFTYRIYIRPYTLQELSKLVQLNSHKFNFDISNEASLLVAKCSRGTPRIANSILCMCRDYVVANNIYGQITSQVLHRVFDKFTIHKMGLKDEDLTYLNILKKFNKPVGLKTLISATNLNQETIENMVEPYLIQLGVIEKTPRGRQLIS